MSADPLPGGLPQDDLAQAQLAAVDTWNRARRVVEATVGTSRLTREMRLDATRRREARQREHEALLARSAQVLRLSGQQLPGTAPIRAVLAHRSEWLRDRVADRLTEAGVEVVAAVEDGADASGTIVVEQPDLVLVEELLPTMPGLQVLRRVRTFAPRTLLAAQVTDSTGVDAFVEAGAAAVFTRRVRPDEVVDHLLRCLTSAEGLVTVR